MVDVRASIRFRISISVSVLIKGLPLDSMFITTLTRCL